MATPDISELSASQQESLQTYTSVTDQDPIAAVPILQRAEWNVQIAIARFFDGEPATDLLPDARASLPTTSTRHTSNLHHDSLFADSRPPPPRAAPEDRVEKIDSNGSGITYQQPSLLLSLLLTPFNLVYRVFTTVLSPFGFLVPGFFTRIFTRLLTQRPRPTRRALPPADNARRFIREFGEEYGDNNLPFIESGFNLTLDNAKKDLKFLLVLLLSPNHDDNATWVRESLLHSHFQDFLSSHRDDLLLWGGNVQDSEAYQVSASLQCTKFPFAALICQTNDSGSSAMTVVMRAVGPMTASDLVAKATAVINAQQSQLRGARAQQAEQHASRSLRQEQDSAYERSLAQDRERARKKKEEQEAQAKAEKDALAATEALETRKQKVAQWKQWRAQSLPPEPGPQVKDAIRVSIRMPSGDRVVHKMRSDADLEELYAFVECYDTLKDGTSAGNILEPQGYEHVYRFKLVSPMPRTVFDLGHGGSVGERIGRGGNLIVEPIEDDETETGE